MSKNKFLDCTHMCLIKKASDARQAQRSNWLFLASSNYGVGLNKIMRFFK